MEWHGMARKHQVPQVVRASFLHRPRCGPVLTRGNVRVCVVVSVCSVCDTHRYGDPSLCVTVSVAVYDCVHAIVSVSVCDCVYVCVSL